MHPSFDDTFPNQNKTPSRPSPRSEKSATHIATPFSELSLLRSFRPESLADATYDQQVGLCRIFLREFDNLFETEQSEWLETCIALNLLSGKDTRPLADRLQPAQQEELARFILQNVDGVEYAQTFHRVWHTLSLQDQERAIKEFTFVRPECALMVAPFARLDRIYIDSEPNTPDERRTKKRPGGAVSAPGFIRGSEKEIQRRSILDEHFSDIDSSKLLVETLLASADLVPKRLTTDERWQRQRLLNRREPNDKNGEYFEIHPGYLVSHYAQVYPLFLLPYLKQLLDAKLLEEVEFSSCLRKCTQADHPEPKERFIFLTQEERSAKTAILTSLYGRPPSAALLMERGHYKVESVSRNIRTRYDALDDAASIRATRHVLGTDLQELNPILRRQIIINLLKEEYPVFIMLDSLPSLQTEAKSIVKEALSFGARPFHLNNLEDFHALIVHGCEEEMFRYLKRKIIDGGDDFFPGRMIAPRVEVVLSWFNESHRRELLETLRVLAPGFWMMNIAADIEKPYLDVARTLKRFSGDAADTQLLYENYLPARYDLAHSSKPETERRSDIGRLTRAVKKSFEEYPGDAFFYHDTFEACFSREEQTAYHHRHVNHCDDGNYLMGMVGEFLKGNFLELKNVYRAHIVTNASAFIGLADKLFVDGNKAKALKIFSPEELYTLIIRHANEIDIRRFFDFSEWVPFFLSDQKRFSALIKTVHQERDFLSLSELIRYIEYKLKSDRDSFQAHLSESTAQRPSEYDTGERDYDHKWRPKEIDQKRRSGRLTPEDRAVYTQEYTHLLELLSKARTDEPALGLEDYMLKVKGLSKQDIPQNVLESHISLYPNDLGRLQRALPEERFSAIYAKRARAMAFLEGPYDGKIFYSSQLPNNVRVAIEDINPLYRIANDKRSYESTPDLHELVMQLLKKQEAGYYDLYKEQFHRLISKERKTEPLKGGDVERLGKPFKDLVQRVSLLNNSPLAISWLNRITPLPKDERENLLDLLETASLYALDTQIKFSHQNTTQDLHDALTRVIAEHMGAIFNFTEDEQASLGEVKIETNTRVLQALMTYATGPAIKEAGMREGLHDFALRVFSGTQAAWRPWGDIEATTPEKQQIAFDRMCEQGVLPKNLTIEQYRAWMAPSTQSLEALLEYEIEDVQLGLRNILGQAVADRHISAEDLHPNLDQIQAELQDLLVPLKELNEQISPLRKKQEEHKKALRAHKEGSPLSMDERETLAHLQQQFANLREEQQEQIDELRAKSYVHALHNIDLEDIRLQSIRTAQGRVPFEAVFKLIEASFVPAYPEIAPDIKRFKVALKDGHTHIFDKGSISKTTLTASNVTDIETQLFIGEIPIPSCQSFRSGGKLNVGLLSYANEANTQILVLRDEEGKLVARAILRLLEDDDGNPQLFMERTYSSDSHRKIQQALGAVAFDIAKRMNVSVFSHETEGADMQTEGTTMKNLHSRRSRSPWIYSDAAGGSKKNGIFTIRDAARLR